MTCPKCGTELETYECSRTDERRTVPHRPSQCIAALVRQRDEAREHAESLDRNWSSIHAAGMDAIREALGMPDATVPEMVTRIEALAALAKEGT